MLLNCGVGEDSWESLGLQGDLTSPPSRTSVLNIHWKDWCWSWNSNTLATWCEDLTHWKRSWCWERLRAGGEGDHRGWDGWMASPTQWTWVWVDSRSWWWMGRPGVLQSIRLQKVGHDWATELNWYRCERIYIRRTDVEAETPVLWLPDVKSRLIWKAPDARKDWGQEEKGTTEDEIVGWHHHLNGHSFGWTLGVGYGQGGLVCCGSWGCKESDKTERLNWTEGSCLSCGIWDLF